MPRNQRELSPALGQSKPGPQTRHDAQKTRAAILHPRVSVLPLLQRSEYVRTSIQLEAFGRNADHGIWFALINERPADGAGIAAKVALPQSIADNRDRRFARSVFIGPKCAPLHGRDTERGE